jgi:hypothetical protein
MTTCLSASPERTKWPEWVGSWPRLTGRQTPEFESKFDGDEETHGDNCGVFGARIGLRQMPWQWLVLRAALSLLAVNAWGERLWTHRIVVIECTRQNGKTLIVVLRILYGLFVLREKRIVYTAQRWSTAEDVFDRVVTVINRVPSLKRRLASKPSKKDNRGNILLTNGARAEFGPRSQDFGRGYTEIDLVFFDEAYDVDAVAERNLTGAQRAALNPQTWYVSTSPVATVHQKCGKFSGLCRSGRKRAANLYYVLFAAPRNMERMDPDAWPIANPSYGVVGDDRDMQTTLENANTVIDRAIADADYLGWAEYAPDESESQSPIPRDLWRDMARRSPVLVGSAAIAIHRSLDGSVWSIGAARRVEDGPVHLEVGPYDLKSVGDVVDKVVEIVTSWDPCTVVIDSRSTAAVLKPRLIAAGFEPTMTTTMELTGACRGVLDDALGGQLSHSAQSDLNDAVLSAEKRDLPSGFAWADGAGGGSVPLVAVTLAHWGLLAFSKPPKQTPVPMADKPEMSPNRRSEQEFDAMSAPF